MATNSRLFMGSLNNRTAHPPFLCLLADLVPSSFLDLSTTSGSLVGGSNTAGPAMESCSTRGCRWDDGGVYWNDVLVEVWVLVVGRTVKAEAKAARRANIVKWNRVGIIL
eukprot:CAMPEP_0198147358 /NCGR_PEP_ID=MMETSP1443-20131203/34934_1 /TAXON_ID=186043 /ORGANISM="Entomoneis sp., Strain CCMP2396" /LENGTH=109 /DNA_ID=CAMNT_0043811643 /DNA_START=411 /DNA_END=743 /DNA_ORIENTATION=-